MRRLAEGLGWLLAIVMAIVASQRDLPGGGLALVLVTALVGLIVTLVHEGGHAIAARFMGARLLVFAVGNVQFDFARRKLRIKRERNREVGGFVAYALPHHAENSRKHLLIAAAGPAANALCAAILAIVLLLGAGPLGDRSRPAIAPMITQGVDKHDARPARLPDQQTIDRLVDAAKAQREADALRRHIATLAILLVIASLGAAVVNLLPFDDSDGAVIRAHWGR